MFLNLREDTEPRKGMAAKLAAVVSGGLLLLIMVAALRTVDMSTLNNPAGFNSQIGLVENLGKVLFTDFLLPFELASVLFLVAMVGAVMLGKREAGERNF
jgi:NADH-quinone oxidoreductase subunit J